MASGHWNKVFQKFFTISLRTSQKERLGFVIIDTVLAVKGNLY